MGTLLEIRPNLKNTEGEQVGGGKLFLAMKRNPSFLASETAATCVGQLRLCSMVTSTRLNENVIQYHEHIQDHSTDECTVK